MNRKDNSGSEMKTYLIQQPTDIKTATITIDTSDINTLPVGGKRKTLDIDETTEKEYILVRDLSKPDQESLRQYIIYNKANNQSLDLTNSQILILKKDLSMYPTLHNIVNFPNRGLRFCSKEIYDCWKNIAFYDKESNAYCISDEVEETNDYCMSEDNEVEEKGQSLMICQIEKMLKQCVFEDELLKVIEIAQNRIASLNDMVGGNSIDTSFEVMNRQINMKKNEKKEKKEKKRIPLQLIEK